MSEKVLIRVGSTSEHKLGAVRDACEALGIDAEVVGTRANSRVGEQPEKTSNKDEIFDGSIARATQLLPFSEVGTTVCVGIENGIERCFNGEVVFDYANIHLIHSGHHYVSRSAGMRIDMYDTETARMRGFDKHTVASVTAERTGCDPKDATPYYTGGRVTRRELLAQAVKVVLAQWLTDEERRKATV